jgi:long-chain acyl-CoA synthetase
MSAIDRKPWAQHYPPGVPVELGPVPFSCLGDMVEASAQRYSELPAFENFGVTLTYADTSRLSRDFAAYLQSGLALAKGERVAIMLPNLLQYPVALFGILRAGLTAVSVNPLYTERELEHQLIDSGATAIVIFESAAHTLQSVVAHTRVRHVIVASVGDMLGTLRGTLINFAYRRVKKQVPTYALPGAVPFPAALAEGARLPFQPPEVGPSDIAFLQYTGGTTGISKGAMLTQHNVLANVEQTRAFFGDRLKTGAEICITCLPLYHIFALVLNCMLYFQLGGKQVLITNPRDLDRFVDTLARSRFTILVGVNTLFNALLNHPRFAQIDFSTMHYCYGGGAPIQASVAQRWKAVTGKPLLEGYGLTETSGVVSATPTDVADHTGTTGFPVPGTEIEIRDDKGAVLPQGAIGQVHVRGPQVMAGYWHRADETIRMLGPDGFLGTGDIGLITPQGYLKIVDRLKDMILVSGFNVYPNEIEEVVMKHPGVLEAVAVGVPDSATGEAVKLFIVKKDAKLSVSELTAYCRAHLTGYKVPRHIEFRGALPKSAVGKILRRQLREPAHM